MGTRSAEGLERAKEMATATQGVAQSAVSHVSQVASEAASQAKDLVEGLAEGLADKGATAAEALGRRRRRSRLSRLTSKGREHPGLLLLGALAAGMAAWRVRRTRPSTLATTPPGTPGLFDRSEPSEPATAADGAATGTSKASLPPRGRDESESIVLPNQGERA